MLLTRPAMLAAYKRRIIFFNLLSMTDRQLYKLCKKYGRRALEARRKYSGLLPEVLRRKLYEKKGFSSIYEFAAKLAGLSRDHVDTVLRLERKFEDKPLLHGALVKGEISPNKLIRIAGIATMENQQEMFETVRNLSRRALDVFVKDYRRGENAGQQTGIFVGDAPGVDTDSLAKNDISPDNGNELKNGQQDGLTEPTWRLKSLAGQTFGTGNLEIQMSNFDYEIVSGLSPEIKSKIKEFMDKGIDINRELMDFFNERERKISQEKEQIATEMNTKRKEQTGQEITAGTKSSITSSAKPSRYIPAKIKKILKTEYGGKCANTLCQKPSENLHHIHKYALTKDHSPKNLEPLCGAHHEIEHKNDFYYQRFRAIVGR